MKKLMIIVSVMFSLAAGSAFATIPGQQHHNGPISNFLGQLFDHFEDKKDHLQSKKDKIKNHFKKKKHHAVPEIDAAGAALAIALLGGVVSIARERRKKA